MSWPNTRPVKKINGWQLFAMACFFELMLVIWMISAETGIELRSCIEGIVQ